MKDTCCKNPSYVTSSQALIDITLNMPVIPCTHTGYAKLVAKGVESRARDTKQLTHVILDCFLYTSLSSLIWRAEITNMLSMLITQYRL